MSRAVAIVLTSRGWDQFQVPAKTGDLCERVMAKCDQGYLCDVCGEEVDNISESDLYLRFVTGQITSQALLASPERHLKCNPIVAQFIVAEQFETPTADGPFAKSEMDPPYVAEQEDLMTRGWQRLQELYEISDQTPLTDYPLPEFRRSTSDR
ncbi:MAG: hypothetical protein NXI04_02300 [Planctomycetaceae bacterium]|nr:hypothetical protein [Planctomycetaceae bacterium]